MLHISRVEILQLQELYTVIKLQALVILQKHAFIGKLKYCYKLAS